MPLATIISAIIGVGGTVAGGLLQNDAAAKANKESKRLAFLNRSDQNRQFNESLKFQKEESAANRAERAEQTSYDRLQNRYAKFGNMYTQQKNVQTLRGQALGRVGQ